MGDKDGNRMSLNEGERGRHQTSGNRKPAFSNKPRVAKGHDAQLKDAQDNGKPVRVVTMAGDTVNGNISNRDRYTITVRNGNVFTIYYKHAIESIQIIEPVTA
jgi:sRNA-binding regulator protein Hfq